MLKLEVIAKLLPILISEIRPVILSFILKHFFQQI